MSGHPETKREKKIMFLLLLLRMTGGLRHAFPFAFLRAKPHTPACRSQKRAWGLFFFGVCTFQRNKKKNLFSTYKHTCSSALLVVSKGGVSFDAVVDLLVWRGICERPCFPLGTRRQKAMREWKEYRSCVCVCQGSHGDHLPFSHSNLLCRICI